MIKLFIFFFLVIWCAGFLFPVIVPQFPNKIVTEQILKYNYSIVCHQQEAASFQSGGNHFLVCARCSGLYLGALLVSVMMLIRIFKGRLNLKPLIIFSLPLVFDALAVRVHLYNYSKVVAFSTGLLCGGIIIIYIFDALQNQSKHSLNDI